MIQHYNHKQAVFLARGLPGSGKTTYFKDLRKATGSCVRYISRDDLRFMLVGEMWAPKKEKAVTDARDALLRRFLTEGACVIVDETFLNHAVLKHIRDICAEFPELNSEFKDFTGMDVDVCVERDIKRGEKAVGAAVIRELSKQCRQPAPPHLPGIPDAIIVDLDGTLALFGKENAYDRDWSKDTINMPVARIIHAMGDRGVKVIITSGRRKQYERETIDWLSANGVVYHMLLMRPLENAEQKDSHLKHDWFDTLIRGNYNVLFALDDRDQVVDMWRSIGVTCLQVEYGGF